MNRVRLRAPCITLLGLFLILIGYWGPWIAHSAASLVQSGLDLSEFVKFLPQVKDGSEPMYRWLFFLPLTTVALGLGFWATAQPWPPMTGDTGDGAHRRTRRQPWMRAALVVLGALLLIILIPPYPFTSERLFGHEFRERTILALGSWLAFLLVLVWLGRRLMRRSAGIALGALTLVGTVSPIVQFLSVSDALGSVYGRPIVIGWGVWMMLVGLLVVLAGAALGLGEADGDIA